VSRDTTPLTVTQRLSVPCTVTGCLHQVECDRPLAPVMCAGCAFWLGAAALLYRATGHEDVYLLAPGSYEPPVGVPRLRLLYLHSGFIMTTVRLVCLGVPPVRLRRADVCAVALELAQETD
jgi:hypothetical protein